jgi:hypothetical protein
VATSSSPQRAWRAACPNCGAPVEFASAASPIAVCSFCRSTLAREGEALRRIGQSAELFEDHSPLQLGAAGQWQGSAFTLIGRLQLRYADGTWNEWHALFDGGKSGWLSEDNGRYVMAFDAPSPTPLPRFEALRPGAGIALDARMWQVASIARVRVAAAQGELPYPPNLADEFAVVDLRNTQDEVGTLDYGDANGVRWSVGRSAPLSELALRGLRDESEKTLKARGVECPSCGTALEIKLESTLSIVCHQCKSVVDVSKGVGGELAHYKQNASQIRGAAPRIPLGSTGTVALGGAPRPWQVVGYVERRSIPEDAEDDAESWREYLLYARDVGFSFLIDAEDGWSWATPITGAPQVRGNAAVWGGATYRKLYAYGGEITYVLGEFYWKLQRGERTSNVDYGAGNKRLNREQTGQEVTWSAGETIDAAKIGKAFALPGMATTALPGEASPLSSGGMSTTKKVFIAIAVLLLIIAIIQSNSNDGCADIAKTFGSASVEYQQCMNSGGGVARIPRTGGGSFGGFGGGGGHK